MALSINLFHEVHKADLDRRRDPFKLAGLGAIGVMALLLLYYFIRLGSVSGLHAQAEGIRDKWKKTQPQQTTAESREKQLIELQKTNKALVNRLHHRFLWGPFLQALVSVTPENIQITSFKGEAPIGLKGADILIAGMAAGPEPRASAENFRMGIHQKFAKLYCDVSAKFDANSLDDSPITVQLQGQTLPTATFKIRLNFRLASQATPTPTPTPAPGRRR